MKRRLIYIGILLSLVVALIAYTAMPVFAWTYTTTIQVIESNSNSYSDLAITALVDNDYLADNGYIGAEGLDTRVSVGGTATQHMVAEDRVNFIYDINADSTSNFAYSFGNDDLDNFYIIPGYDGYITVSDDADLELGDTFEIDQKGYIDTLSGSDKNLVYKEDAFSVYISAHQEITATFEDWVSPTGGSGTGWVTPANAYDDNTGTKTTASIDPTWTSPSSFSDPASDWTDEGNIYDEDTGTRATCDIGVDRWGNYIELIETVNDCTSIRYFADRDSNIVEIDIDVYYEAAWHDVYEGAHVDMAWDEKSLGGAYDVTKARVRFYNDDTEDPNDAYLHEFDFGEASWSDYLTLTRDAFNCDTVKFYADYDAASIDMIDLDAYYTAAWHDVYEGAFTDETWIEKTVSASPVSVTQVRARFRNIAIDTQTAGVYEVSLRQEESVTVTGITSGVRRVVTDADGTDLTLSVYDDEDEHLGDSPQSGSLNAGSVSDNANDWLLIQNNVMPYMEYYKHTTAVGGSSLKAHYELATMVEGTTLPDEQGGDEPGAFTWGANPAGVAVSLGSATPYSVGIEAEGELVSPDVVTPMGIDMWSLGEAPDNMFSPLIDPIADIVDVPALTLWVLLATGILILVTAFGYLFFPHLIVVGVIQGLVIGFFIAMGVFPFWFLGMVAIGVTALVIYERVPAV